MIKAIAIDLGGVLFAEGKSAAADKLVIEYGYDKEIVLGILKSEKSIELRKGLISDGDFWDWAQNQLPEGYDAQLIKTKWYESYILDKEVFDLLKKLRRRCTLLAFSNNIQSKVDYLDKKYGFRKYFHKEVYSYEHHLFKPEKKFVEVMIKSAGVKPQEIVYIDDNLKDGVPAKNLGVNVIIYSRGQIERLKEELRKLHVVF